jgi:alpha/beta superfamily hydrolase
VITGANHFFDNKIEPLMQNITGYLDKRLKPADATSAA